jgi:ABC-type lipoprotein export system ATPase subunit
MTTQQSAPNHPDPLVDVYAVERTFTLNGRSVQALRGVHLSVGRGAFVALMGPSGSGKTTLLNIIGGLDHPSAGTVSIDQQRLDQLSSTVLTSLRRRIGFVFQSFALLPTASAYENVELALRIAGTVPREHWDLLIRRCLQAVGLLPWLRHRPYELSGGQQQRVVIARALAIRPRLILADEPTGDLDSKTSRQILALLRALVEHEHMTLLMATHDPLAAEFATNVYHLRDGQIVGHHPSEATDSIC